MTNLERKFTPREILDIIYEGGVYEDDGLGNGEEDIKFKTVYEEVTYTDLEKSYQNVDYVIQEINTGLFYKTSLMICSDQQHVQDRNIKQEWKLVEEYTEIIKKYE